MRLWSYWWGRSPGGGSSCGTGEIQIDINTDGNEETWSTRASAVVEEKTGERQREMRDKYGGSKITARIPRYVGKIHVLSTVRQVRSCTEYIHSVQDITNVPRTKVLRSHNSSIGCAVRRSWSTRSRWTNGITAHDHSQPTCKSTVWYGATAYGTRYDTPYRRTSTHS